MGSNSSKKQVKALQNLHIDEIPELVKNRNFIAKVIDCYDGDTCTIVFLLGNVPVKIKLRLNGIDTAELPRRKDGSDRTPEERELAYAARDFLKERVLEQCVYIELKGWDKWGGRVLGYLFCVDKKGRVVGISLNEQLLEEGLAVPYTGKKDVDWNYIHKMWKEQ
jgi:endonuclease YncB( thermonuclease family)